MFSTLLTENERFNLYNTGACECGGELREGPSGGLSTNYICSHDASHRYNVRPGAVDRLYDRGTVFDSSAKTVIR